jgi:NADPH2:quinone reductase
MRAYLLTKSGKPKVLKIHEVPDPQLREDNVVVNMKYVGINYADILSRKGLYGWTVKRPYILGMEGSGVVEDVGKGTDLYGVGDEVIVCSQYGCYAEKVSVPPAFAVPALGLYNMEENAAFIVNFMTAWVSLFELAKLEKGVSVLVTAAAGGVGTAVVQLASKYGAQVYGLVGSIEKAKFVKQLGAVEAFNYRDPTWFDQLKQTGTEINVVIEMVGGEVFKKCFKILSPFGRFVVMGFASLDLKKWNPYSWWNTWRDIPRVSIMDLAVKSGGVMASHLGYLLRDQERMLNVYKNLKHFINKSDIRPVVGKIFEFDQAPAAHAHVESRKSYGKILLRL